MITINLIKQELKVRHMKRSLSNHISSHLTEMEQVALSFTIPVRNTKIKMKEAPGIRIIIRREPHTEEVLELKGQVQLLREGITEIIIIKKAKYVVIKTKNFLLQYL